MSERDRPIDNGHRGPLPDADPPSSIGRWGIAERLWLTLGLLVLIPLVGGLIAYRHVQQIGRDVIQVVAVKEPLEQAVLEMEINAGETARAVLDYIYDLEPEHLVVMRDSEADFQDFAARFEHLAETAEERRLGRVVATLYADFKTLGNEIVALADERQSTLVAFRRDVLEIDEIIDERLKPSVEGNTLDEKKKWRVAVALDELIDESFPAIEGYVLHPDAVLRAEIADAQRDFERFEAMYRETSLSDEENRWLEEIVGGYTGAVTAGRRIMAITDEIREKLVRFEDDLTAMDALLDDQIQPLIHAETVKAADGAKASTERAALWLSILGVVALSFGCTAAWAVHRSIIKPVRALHRGMEVIAGGTLTHRIDIARGDEFGELAAGFNHMVGNLARGRRAVEDARRQLEQRVEERTAELTNELAARAQAEVALRESRARFRDFAGASADWFWEMDAELRFSDISDRFFEVFHLSREGVIGKTRRELTGADTIAAEPEKWRAHFDDLEARRPIRKFTYPITSDDGETRYLSLGCVPVFDDEGNFAGYRGTDSDVTARVRAEQGLRAAKVQAELASRSKSEFLANMSHELRTPLNAIIGFSEMILTELFGPVGNSKYIEYTGDIKASGEHLLELINDILDLSKIEAGKLELYEEEIDVRRIVKTCLTFVKERARSNGVELAGDVPDDIPVLFADERKIKQVLLNLLSNAVKFTPAGGVVTVRVRIDDRSGLTIEVIDTGIGITPEDIPKALALFGQVVDSLNREYAGTGLGLPLSDSLARLHGGSLALNSSPATGTTVTLMLPPERLLTASGEEQARRETV